MPKLKGGISAGKATDNERRNIEIDDSGVRSNEGNAVVARGRELRLKSTCWALQRNARRWRKREFGHVDCQRGRLRLVVSVRARPIPNGQAPLFDPHQRYGGCVLIEVSSSKVRRMADRKIWRP